MKDKPKKALIQNAETNISAWEKIRGAFARFLFLTWYCSLVYLFWFFFLVGFFSTHDHSNVINFLVIAVINAQEKLASRDTHTKLNKQNIFFFILVDFPSFAAYFAVSFLRLLSLPLDYSHFVCISVHFSSSFIRFPLTLFARLILLLI